MRCIGRGDRRRVPSATCRALLGGELRSLPMDAFHDEAARQGHLSGPIGQALMAHAPELFASPPSIEPIEVLGLKNTGTGCRGGVLRSGKGTQPG